MVLHNRVRTAIFPMLVGTGLLFFASTISAQNFWTGQGGDNLWSNASNWSELQVPSSNGAIGQAEFIQAGATNFETTVFDLGSSSHSITINGDAGPGITITGFLTANAPSFNGSGLSAHGLLGLRFNVLAGEHIIEGAMEGGGNFDVGFSPSSATEEAPKEHGFYVADGAKLTFNATLGRSVAGHNLLKKHGDGTVVFNGATSMGQTRYEVDDGILQFGASRVRGNSGNPVTVNDGGTLQLNNVAYGSNNGVLTINGAGHNGMGALHATGGVDSNIASITHSSGEIRGKVIIASDASIGVDAGSVLRLAHGIDSSGFGNLTKVGAGSLIFDANNSPAQYGYSGTITVAEGTLLVNSQANASVVSGTIDTGNIGATAIALSNNEGLSVGQEVSGPGVGAGAFVTAVSSDGVRVIVSQLLSDASGDYTFGGISSALNNSPVIVQSGATLGGVGSVLGSSIAVDAGGNLAPGSSIGTFTAGDTTLDGTLQVEFGNDSIDKLAAGGVLDLTNATVDFSGIGSLVNGEYVFATYDTLVNDQGFADVLNLPDSLTLHHDETNQWFSLIGEFSAGLDGDHNDDGVVDAADYVFWRDTMNDNTSGYTDWKANFGATSGSGAGVGQAAVPEPSALAFIAMAIAAVASRALRRRV